MLLISYKKSFVFLGNYITSFPYSKIVRWRQGLKKKKSSRNVTTPENHIKNYKLISYLSTIIGCLIYMNLKTKLSYLKPQTDSRYRMLFTK